MDLSVLNLKTSRNVEFYEHAIHKSNCNYINKVKWYYPHIPLTLTHFINKINLYPVSNIVAYRLFHTKNFSLESVILYKRDTYLILRLLLKKMKKKA